MSDDDIDVNDLINEIISDSDSDEIILDDGDSEDNSLQMASEADTKQVSTAETAASAPESEVVATALSRVAKPRTKRNAVGQATELVRERVALHKQKRLKAQHREGYHRRIVNVGDNRIEQFEIAGYSVVTDGSALSDSQVGEASEVSSAVGKSVGKGMRAVLMEIPLDIYNQDQADKQRDIDEKEQLLYPNEDDGDKSGLADNLYGSLNIDRGGKGSGKQSVKIQIDK